MRRNQVVQHHPNRRHGRGNNSPYNSSRKPDHIPSRNNRRQIRGGGERWKVDYFSARTSTSDATRRNESFSRGRVHAGRGRVPTSARKRTAIRKNKKLEEIHSSKSSIHNDWKEKYGGLIRYYVNYIKDKNNIHDINNEFIMDDVYQIYIKNECDLEKMKDDILKSMDYESGSVVGESYDKKDNKNWIDLSIIIEDNNTDYSNKGIKLKNEKIAGDKVKNQGRKEELCNVVKIPNSAVGKTYHFEVLNRSPCDLSCEITIDGISSKAAKNAPIPAKSCRTIKPDNNRYFHTHKWTFNPSQRVSLQNCKFIDDEEEGQERVISVNTPAQVNTKKAKGKRYNGIRPDYENKRLSYEDYPDPTSHGWIFTGSCTKSKVEFFDKSLNMGTVKLDFYYTTGTVKTVLLHPSTGANQLFRKCAVLSNLYKDILTNPRVHTGIGYRTVTDFDSTRQHPPPLPNHNNVVIKLEDEDDDDDDNNDNDIDVTMEDNNNDESNNDCPQTKNYYAKNEKYAFRTQGHVNRQTQLNQAMVLPDSQFNKWRKASTADWACITAKFYISVAETKRRILVQNNNSYNNSFHNGGTTRQPTKEPLPPMTPIVDIKSNENVVLSTKFQPFLHNNISNSHISSSTSDRPVRSSNVRMKRVIGLNDKPSSTKSEPLFEYKLYYRAEESSNDQLDNDDDDNMMEEGEVNNSDISNNQNEEEMHNNNDSNYYQELKSAKLNQMQMYHNEYINKHSSNLTAQEKQDANDQFHKFQSMLMEFSANNTNISNIEDDLDNIVKNYFDWNMKMQWNQNQL